MVTPSESWIDRAIMDPLSMDVIISNMIQFCVSKAGYHLYGRDRVFETLIDHLQWARQNRKPFVFTYVFFTLYVNFPEIQRAVDKVEKLVYPGTSDGLLSFVWTRCSQILCDVQMQAFEPSVMLEVSSMYRCTMVTVIFTRHPTLLGFSGFDPKTFIDTHDNMKACNERCARKSSDKRLDAETVKRFTDKLRQYEPGSQQWAAQEKALSVRYPLVNHMTICPNGQRLTRREAIERLHEEEELTAHAAAAMIAAFDEEENIAEGIADML